MSNKKTYLFDVHTHTNCDQLLGQWVGIAEECARNNIIYFNVGTTTNTSNIAVTQAKAKDNVYAIVGIHPCEVNQINWPLALEEIEELIVDNDNKIIAIGECGLDYHYPNHNKEIQREVFLAHIKLAHKYSLPLMVHVRDAHEDVLKILRKFARNLHVIIHCFSSNRTIARKYLNLGCYFSFNGIITFDKVDDIKQAIKIIPLKKIFSETDAPWLSPAPFRNKINTPNNIGIIVKKIAELKRKKYDQIVAQIQKNVVNVFKLDLK